MSLPIQTCRGPPFNPLRHQNSADHSHLRVGDGDREHVHVAQWHPILVGFADQNGRFRAVVERSQQLVGVPQPDQVLQLWVGALQEGGDVHERAGETPELLSITPCPKVRPVALRAIGPHVVVIGAPPKLSHCDVGCSGTAGGGQWKAGVISETVGWAEQGCTKPQLIPRSVIASCARRNVTNRVSEESNRK